MSLVLEIPDAVEQALRLPEAERERLLLQELSLALYARGSLPFGKARQLAGMNRLEFGLLLGRRDVPRHFGEEDLAGDVQYADGE